jgi:small GTP-binding protein
MSVKVILVGDAAVGKTSLILAYLSQPFSEASVSTTSAVFFQVTRTIEHREVNLEIWDTAGQETYRSLMALYYRSAHIALLCVTRETVEWAAEWAAVVRQSEPACAVIVVFTKSDLLSESELNEVYANGAQLQATLQAAEFVVTSARLGEGVQEAFTAAARIALTIERPGPRRVDSLRKNQGQSGCC